jgi:hypothetical protein
VAGTTPGELASTFVLALGTMAALVGFESHLSR